MRGQILQVETAGGGIITGSDGNRYSFRPSDWRGPVAPVPGADVDFITGDGVAQDIFPLPGSGGGPAAAAAAPRYPSGQAVSEGSSVTLGIIGLVCLALGFVIPVIPTIAALILGLVGADSAKRHNNSTGLVLSRISWIGAAVLIVVGIGVLIVALLFAWPFLDVFWQYLMSIANQETAQTALFRQ